MLPPRPPDDEEARLAALHELQVLDTLPEQVYDDIVALAAHIAGTPIALVSLVDADRQWFKARTGLDATQTPRDISFCGHVVQDAELLVVDDATKDPRFADNPLVTGGPRIRFYAGAPVRSEGGHVLGTLCVIDQRPRSLDPHQLSLLAGLGRQVSALLAADHRRRLLDRARADFEAEKKAHKALTRLEGLFWSLAGDLECVATFEGRLVRVNPAWSRVLGHQPEDLVGASWIELVHPDDQEQTASLAAALASGERPSIKVKNRFRHADGSWRWFSWSAIADADVQRILAVARDITESREQLAELAAARDHAEEANRAKSAFLANMSHELRTPLNSVIGFSSVLARNKDERLSPRDLVCVDRIAANGRHLLGLINDMLDLSKIEAGHVVLQPEDVDLAELVAEVVGSVGQAAGDGAGRIRVVTPAMHPVRADRRRLSQVLRNLVSNALKFGGEAPVLVRLIGDQDRPQSLQVADAGIGIPEDKRELIFEPFRQADDGTERRYGGTGLGLAISRRLCAMQGFRLLVDSRVDAGSTFAVLLTPDAPAPVHVVPGGAEAAAGPDSKPGPPPTPRVSAQGAPGTVMVVDDDTDARMVLERYLEDLGHRVITADSGERALELARLVQPQAILLDLMMPGLDGWEVLRRIKAEPELAEIPVVICSIVASENRATLGQAAGLLDKPVTRGDLADTLARLRPEGPAPLVVVESADRARDPLRAALASEGHKTRFVAQGEDLVESLRQAPAAAVILALPPAEMVAVLGRLEAEPALSDLPVLLYVDSDDEPGGPEVAGGQGRAVLRPSTVQSGQLGALLAGVVAGRGGSRE